MSATARSPFALPEHKMGKGGMRFEPDRFCGRGAAVPGGVHHTGGGRGVPAASVGGTAHPAGAQRDGGGHHAGGQRVEPAAAGH